MKKLVLVLLLAAPLAACQTASERQQALIAKLNRSCDQLGYTSGQQRLECLRTMAQIEQANEAAEEARTQRAAAALQAAGQSLQSIGAGAPAPSFPTTTQCRNLAGMVQCNSF
ncbi:hypothetical protein [Bradyrhizobium diazoefficiens]|nr:hypothetical protein XF16B_46840 [Bradyrhizobium diazoefficiens]BCF70337.1 hypothetical protein XF19B_46900 [Bradyrhizobium diazoefficiens]